MRTCPYRIHLWLASFLALLLLVAASGCETRRVKAPSPTPDPVAPESLVDQSGEPLSRKSFLDKVREADYILLGENHVSPCHHRVQADIIDTLARNGVSVAIGLEMVPFRNQETLDRFNSGEIGVEDLPNTLDWQDVWGYPFSLYRPVFKAAEEAGFSLHGLNVDADLLEDFRAGGMQNLGDSQLKGLPCRIIPPPREQKTALEREYERHLELEAVDRENDLSRERFFRVQSLWDSAMAERARQVREQSGLPVLVLSGAGHVEYGWGIAHRLSVLDESPEILSILPWRGQEKPETERGDTFFYCPRAHPNDLGFTLRLNSRGERTS